MKMGFKKNKKIYQKGFTLVELMVSLVIFSTVMVISAGTLLIMVDINAKAQAIYSSTTNLAFALDNMTRELRTGYHYYCGMSVPTTLPTQGSTNNCSGGVYVAFTREKDGSYVAYRMNNARIEQYNEGLWVPLTSEDVVVEIFELTVANTEPYYPLESNQNQPVVDIFISGYVNNGLDENTDFSIQSRVVQRRLDII